jgi:hypothetical protein
LTPEITAKWLKIKMATELVHYFAVENGTKF